MFTKKTFHSFSNNPQQKLWLALTVRTRTLPAMKHLDHGSSELPTMIFHPWRTAKEGGRNDQAPYGKRTSWRPIYARATTLITETSIGFVFHNYIQTCGPQYTRDKNIPSPKIRTGKLHMSLPLETSTWHCRSVTHLLVIWCCGHHLPESGRRLKNKMPIQFNLQIHHGCNPSAAKASAKIKVAL